MSETTDNLGKAFAGESQANRRYLAFAAKAEADCHPVVAKLFRAAAEAETIHALNILRAMDAIKSTEENLEEAAKGENYEHTQMYPSFIEQAKKDEQALAVQVFSWANSVEKIHEELYKKALDSLKAGKEPDAKHLFICPVCGFTAEENAPDVCPVCGAPKDSFKEIV